MRKTIAEKAGILLLAGLLAVLPACAEETKESFDTAEQVPVLELPALESGEIVEIPVEHDSLSGSIAPHDECYIFPEGSEVGADTVATGYSDPSITVNLGWGRIYETNFVYARVKIAKGSQIRTLMAGPVNTKSATPGSNLAKRVNAVIAINGDYFGGTDLTMGAIMRQGTLYRMKCDQHFDILIIDREGNFTILQDASNEDVEAVQDQAANIFTFGPALVIDGVPQYGKRSSLIASHRPAQRMAIAQTGELEYLLITSEGPEDRGSVGLTIDQFVDLLASFPDVKTAYNLDGGSSSTMIFRKGEKNWEKINAPNNKKIRPLKDIIFFADAWNNE